MFRDLDLDLHAGELAVLTGPSGSGRTSALLALAGRFRTSHGSLEPAARPALGLVRGVHEPDPMLTVAEHLGERLRLHRPLGWPTRSRRRAHRGLVARHAATLPVAPELLAGELDPLHRHLLMLRLALLADPDLIAIDDVDAGLTIDESVTLWAHLRGLADLGVAVLATAREVHHDLPDLTLELPK
ncbi:ABC-2 type transport system ATP-binding protein [Allocatelliglobosispora scoriae]|uniref:ABC-2 type transport system ATP-binding protein n=1 Tax=Allocatelliglobosispora scoriae TaxID=643052 RepID=A0A841BZC1_9ACTN|nr:ATP-binding cassette domain-containing protein [Allocatelliglobosispora scoriae]MBB5872439.1 ABC-2 type transport system ATP-binding protein [Allocatelliglobosispora scoriae]